MRLLLHLLATVLAPAMIPSSGLDCDANCKASDLSVLGKLESQEYIGSLDDFGLNGVITARLRISRTLSGRAPATVVKVRYIAHGYLSEDSELRFHLRRSDDGEYLVCSDGGRGFVCR